MLERCHMAQRMKKVAAGVPLGKAKRSRWAWTEVGGCSGKWAARLLAGSGPGHVGVPSWIASPRQER